MIKTTRHNQPGLDCARLWVRDGHRPNLAMIEQVEAIVMADATANGGPIHAVPFGNPIGLLAAIRCAIDVQKPSADVELRRMRAGAVVVVNGHGGYLTV